PPPAPENSADPAPSAPSRFQAEALQTQDIPQTTASHPGCSSPSHEILYLPAVWRDWQPGRDGSHRGGAEADDGPSESPPRQARAPVSRPDLSGCAGRRG